LDEVNADRSSIARLDANTGRCAALADLRRCLLTAPPAYLEGALFFNDTATTEMLLLLRNRQATPSLLTRVGDDRHWVRKSEVRRLLVQHPRIPLGLARTLLGHLFWKELSEVAGNLRVHPFVRRQAERLLQVRLEGLTAGEKIALARRAPRGVLTSLIHSDDVRVLRSVLGNPSLIEQDAVTIARGGKASAELLAYLSNHPKWGARRSIRLALIKNPRTPVPVALKLVGALPRRELRELIRDASVPKIVRVGAERRLSPTTVIRC
jgi:hypothetical protein